MLYIFRSNLIIDSKISWVPHITYVKNKISKGIGIMYKARRYLSKKCLVNLYHSYIYPYLIYCIESWGNASDCHLEQLYFLQKKIIRIVTYSDFNISSDILFKNLQILPLNKLIHHRIGIMMFKYANGLLPQVMDDLYTTNSNVHSHFTRQFHLLHINKGSINVFTRSFANTSARVWNSLQSNIDVFVPLPTFKRVLKMYLMYHSLQLHYPKW